MIVLPSTDEAEPLADWVEASLSTQEIDRISDTAIIESLLEAEFAETDELLTTIIQTVRARDRIVGDAYPFRRNGMGFARRAGTWRDYLPYSFMLFTSLNQNYRELNYHGGSANRPAEFFECLASKAIEKYLHCSVIRIGAPRRQPVPSQFPKALEYTVAELGELIGQRDLEHHNSGDDGVDLIGWRTFDDSRASQAIIFAQCAIGTDWRTKRDGVNLEMWRRHIDWHSWPLKGFAVPFHHQPGNSWRETASRGGIIFDRLRIAKLVADTDLSPSARNAMLNWCETRALKIFELTADSSQDAGRSVPQRRRVTQAPRKTSLRPKRKRELPKRFHAADRMVNRGPSPRGDWM